MPALRLLTTFLIAGLALAAAGCGSGGEGQLSSAQAKRLIGYVDAARAAFDDGQCAAARSQAGEGARRAARFKGELDEELRQNLIDGFNHLERELASNCDKPKETATPEETVTETPTEEPTETPSPTPEPTESPTPEPTVTVAPTPSAVPTPDTGGTDPDEQGAVLEDPNTR